MSEDVENIVERIKKNIKTKVQKIEFQDGFLEQLNFNMMQHTYLPVVLLQEDKSSKENFEKLSKEEQEYLLDICLNSLQKI